MNNSTQSVLGKSITQQMIEEFWLTYPENAPRFFHHSVNRDGVQLMRCDNDVYVFATEEGEYWSYEEAKHAIGQTFPSVNQFFLTTNQIKLYLSRFGLGDWAKGVKFYPPHDWRSKGNHYPGLNSGAVAILEYDGGAWYSAMNEEKLINTAENETSIRDGFLFWLGDRGYSYEVLNNISLALFKPLERS